LLDFASDSGGDEDLQERLQHHFAKLFKFLAVSGTNLVFQLVSTCTEEKAWKPAAPENKRISDFMCVQSLFACFKKRGKNSCWQSVRRPSKKIKLRFGYQSE